MSTPVSSVGFNWELAPLHRGIYGPSTTTKLSPPPSAAARDTVAEGASLFDWGGFYNTLAVRVDGGAASGGTWRGSASSSIPASKRLLLSLKTFNIK